MKQAGPLLSSAVLLLLCLLGGAALAHEAAVPAAPAPASRDLTVTVRIPLFSPAFAATPIARVNDQAILLGGVTPALQEVDRELPLAVEPAALALSRRFQQRLDARIAELSQGQSPVVCRVEVFAQPKIAKDRTLTLQIPLFSPLFAELAVALVNEEPIALAEFARDLAASHAGMEAAGAPAAAGETGGRLLDRLIAVRLVEQESRNIGFDQTETVRRQVAAYAEKTLLYDLLNLQVADLSVDETEADRLYRQISLQGKFGSYRFAKEEDAVALATAVAAGGTFRTLIKQALQEGRAVKEPMEDFTRFKDLKSQVAGEAATMELGAVSKVYRQSDGFVLFQLEDRQFVEDPAALAFARQSVWDKQVAAAADRYMTGLIQQYASFQEAARSKFDFRQIKAAQPDLTLAAALQPLLSDPAPLVTVAGAAPGTLTIAELAAKLQASFFHGADGALDAVELDQKKEALLSDILFRWAGKMEAAKLGLDQRPDYRHKVAEFERKTLFDHFLQKVVVPEVQLGDKDFRQYYREHQDQYRTPAMVKLKSLPFAGEKEARAALKKLQGGSDLKWVAANSEGLVRGEADNLLVFDRNILSVAVLPPLLRPAAVAAKPGESMVYADPGNFYYLLFFENVYPSEPKPYEQVAAEIKDLVFQERVQQHLEQWVSKLKEAYETQVYLVVGLP